MKGLGDAFKDLTGISLGSVTAVGAITAAFGYLKDAVGETIEYAMDVKDFAMMLGTTAEEASKLIQIGDDLRISQEQMGMAFRFALNNGVTPTVEGLAELSATMMAMDTPAERMQFAIDAFGSRAGEAMMRILEQGPDAIREMSDELENSALIMSGDAVQAADDLRLKLDELNDTAEGIKISVGTWVVDAILDTIHAIEGLKGIHEGWATSVERLDYLLAEGVITLEERNEAYDKMNRNFTDEQIPTMAEVSRQYHELIAEQEAWVASMNMAYPEEERFIAMMQGLPPALDDAANSSNWLQLAMDTLSGEFDEGKITQQLMAEAIQSVSDEMIDQQKLTLELAEAMGTLTDAEIAEREQALLRIENMTELNRALDDGTLSWDGYVAILEDGQITQQEVIDLLGAEKAALYAIRDAADAAAGDYKMRFDIEVTGDQIPSYGGGGGNYIVPMAAGGDFMVNRPTVFLAGEAGPERAIFVPQGQSLSDVTGGGGGDTQYILHIHEAGNRGNVLQDFAILKALAGGG